MKGHSEKQLEAAAKEDYMLLRNQTPSRKKGEIYIGETTHFNREGKNK